MPGLDRVVGVAAFIRKHLRPIWSVPMVAGLAAFLLAAPAAAQVAPPVGYWQCTANAAVYGLELEVQFDADGRLYARGVVIYHGVQNPFTPVEGYGDWTLLPPDAPGGQYLFKFRMFPQAQNHPIVTWFASPTGPGIMYNLFRSPDTGATVETQCSKLG